MLRRTAFLVAAAVAGTVIATLPAVPASASAPVTLFTIDRATRNLMTSVSTYTSPTVAATTSPAGGLRFTSSVTLTVAPPTGQQLTAGTSFSASSVQSSTNG